MCHGAGFKQIIFQAIDSVVQEPSTHPETSVKSSFAGIVIACLVEKCLFGSFESHRKNAQFTMLL